MTWRFNDRRGVEIRHAGLTLYWEVNGDPISGNYTPEDVDAEELWRLWVDEYGSAPHETLGPGWLPISWLVEVESPDRATLEYAPFQYSHGVPIEEHFLTFFSWPVSEATGDPLRWPELPVMDKLWRAGRGDKGGFIQEATGWKPSAYEPFMYVPAIAQAARLYYPA